MKIAVISVTSSGDIIAEKLKDKLEVDLYSKDIIKSFGIKEISKRAMEEYQSVIFISSTGIAIRAIAEYIRGKDTDPAVLVVDSFGKFVISLLSGHLGGANELTLKVAEILNNTPVITTATDNLGVVAPDMVAKNNGLVIDSLKDAKKIAALLVEKKKVGFFDTKGKISIPKGYRGRLEDIDGLLYVTHNLQDNIGTYLLKSKEITKDKERNYGYNYCLDNKANKKSGEDKFDLISMSCLKKIPALRLIRKDIVLGIGCRKNYNSKEMKENVINLLREMNLDERAVKVIATVEVKKDEKAILELVQYFKCELKIFSVEEIKKVHLKYDGSDFVEKTIGVRAVAEPSVELTGAKLITDKIKINGMTVSVGEFC